MFLLRASRCPLKIFEADFGLLVTCLGDAANRDMVDQVEGRTCQMAPIHHRLRNHILGSFILKPGRENLRHVTLQSFYNASYIFKHPGL